MGVGVREYLEKLGHKVGYDKNTGDVLVDSENGKMKSISSDRFTLKDDGRYYAESESDILDALKKNNISYVNGYSAVRNSLGKNNTVGYNNLTGQVNINGRDYNVDGVNFIRVGDEIFGKNDFMKNVEADKYENKFENYEKKIIDELLKDEYEGYDPSDDRNYQMAYKSFMNSAKADMGSRGLVSDSLASYYAAQGAEKLMPEYAKLHYEKYKDERKDKKDAVQTLLKMDENRMKAYQQNADDYHKALEFSEKQRKNNTESEDVNKKLEWEKEKNASQIKQEQEKTNMQFETEREKNKIQKNQNEIKAALERAELLGYVTKEDAEILNVPEGSKIFDAVEKEKDRDFDAEQAKLKSERDLENSRLLEEQKSQNRIKESKVDHEEAKEMSEINHKEDIEIRKIQNELNISKAKATAYYNALYK